MLLNKNTLIGGLFIFLMITAFTSLAFCQGEVKPIGAAPFTLKNMEGGDTSLEGYYPTAKAVAVFFIKVSAATKTKGNKLARHLENEYKDKWKSIPASVLIVAHGDSNDIRQATNGITLPVLRGTDEVLNEYNVVAAFALYVICVERNAGIIIARFDAPADIESEKVDIAVKSCVLKDYIIKAPFDDEEETGVFKKPDGSPLTNSEIMKPWRIDSDFSREKRVGGRGASIKISFAGERKGSFSIDLVGADMSQAGYLSMWILGKTGAEQFHIAIEDGNRVENQLIVSDYIRVQKSRWQRVSIPLTHFNDRQKARPTRASAQLSPLDFKEVSSVSLRFDQGFGEATIYVDDLGFYKGELPRISDIIELIKQSQKDNVRESYGTWAGQCFTDEDYDKFSENETAKKIANELKGNRKFIAAVIALKALSKEERDQFIEKCRQTYRKTWQEIGKITPEGQTEAGQKADKDIAKAVADTVSELCKLSPEEIRTVFEEHK